MGEAVSSQLSAISYTELAGQLRYPADPAMQELYVATFEFNPACTLEVGWHLFGENYERGEFLARMRQQLRRFGIPEGSELPDHLGLLLLLIARLDHEAGAELAGQFLLPALGKIGTALKDNAYEPLIAAVEAKLEADFPDAPRRPTQLPVFQEAACE